MTLSSNTVFSSKPFDKVFMLGLYTVHMFFNPERKQCPFCLHLYDNTQDKCIYVGYFSSVLQLSNHVSTYVIEKYTDNNIEYDKESLSVSIESMSDTLDMLCYDKATEDEVLKFVEEYDFSEHMVAYKNQLYFILSGCDMKGAFIELEDGTRILVEDITD